MRCPREIIQDETTARANHLLVRRWRRKGPLRGMGRSGEHKWFPARAVTGSKGRCVSKHQGNAGGSTGFGDKEVIVGLCWGGRGGY